MFRWEDSGEVVMRKSRSQLFLHLEGIQNASRVNTTHIESRVCKTLAEHERNVVPGVKTHIRLASPSRKMPHSTLAWPIMDSARKGLRFESFTYTTCLHTARRQLASAHTCTTQRACEILSDTILRGPLEEESGDVLGVQDWLKALAHLGQVILACFQRQGTASSHLKQTTVVLLARDTVGAPHTVTSETDFAELFGVREEGYFMDTRATIASTAGGLVVSLLPVWSIMLLVEAEDCEVHGVVGVQVVPGSIYGSSDASTYGLFTNILFEEGEVRQQPQRDTQPGPSNAAPDVGTQQSDGRELQEDSLFVTGSTPS
ncbi:hypothetical protein AC579_7008 [Pseudocercospora musae]|uniref:Uncharacterized protein n=1 Tax=Pseudocercospora musae TaxID=113226 RepID=A0A139HDD1_9PEZI|nr:hypothetical protein AC579_7008 [Pseudocercospora musae]